MATLAEKSATENVCRPTWQPANLSDILARFGAIIPNISKMQRERYDTQWNQGNACLCVCVCVCLTETNGHTWFYFTYTTTSTSAT